MNQKKRLEYRKSLNKRQDVDELKFLLKRFLMGMGDRLDFEESLFLTNMIKKLKTVKEQVSNKEIRAIEKRFKEIRERYQNQK